MVKSILAVKLNGNFQSKCNSITPKELDRICARAIF